VRFLIDTQLPQILAARLREAGYDARHVMELGLAQSPDNEIWEFADEYENIILTKDEDFAHWVLTARKGPAVVWLRVGNCTNHDLLGWILPAFPRIIESLKQGDRLVEVC
jgi:predicted nuclease of predicted toxin-antitoxin system